MAFIGGLGLASLVLSAAVASMLIGGAPNQSTQVMWGVVLGVNFLLISALGGSLAWRIVRIARAKDDKNAAPRMHLRFAGFLSLAAIAPAVIVALFVGAIFIRLIDGWFSERIGGSVNTITEVARASQNAAFREVRQKLLAVAGDLNNADAARAMESEPVTYREYLRQQAVYAEVEALYIINSDGSVLVRVERSENAQYYVPASEDFAQANQGEPPVGLDRQDGRLRALAHLDLYPDAYLYFAAPLDPEVFASLKQAEAAFAEFQETALRRDSLLAFLGVIYGEMTLVVVLGAAWLGLRAASRLVTPIGQLVQASERVGRGDLDARVALDDRSDEMAGLSRTFNQMTEQLASQRAELIEAREVAERRREFTEAVLAGVSAGVLGIDPQGRITLANTSAIVLLGAESENELIGRPAQEMAGEFVALIQDAHLADGVAEGNVDLDRDGEIANLRVRAAAAQDKSGAVVVTFDDMTRLISAQRSAAWRDVARRIAHEIKNPLTPIQLSAERLKRKYAKQITTDEETYDRCITSILNQVNDIRRMVDEFSAFARMPAPHVARTAIGPLVRDAVFSRRVADPSIEFPVTINSEEIFAMCDERLVAQALTNVLKNAAEAVAARLEATPGDKAAKGVVQTTVTAQHGNAVIKVEDNGPGWPVSHRERLLEPYMTTREKGAGLGLAIVNRVMEDHAGRLELADRADGRKGAVVRLVLPLAAEETQSDVETPDEQTRAVHGA